MARRKPPVAQPPTSTPTSAFAQRVERKRDRSKPAAKIAQVVAAVAKVIPPGAVKRVVVWLDKALGQWKFRVHFPGGLIQEGGLIVDAAATVEHAVAALVGLLGKDFEHLKGAKFVQAKPGGSWIHQAP